MKENLNLLKFLKKPVVIASIIIIPILYTVPLYSSRYLIQILLTIFLYINLVVAWNIFSGYTGYLFLGVAAIYGIAGYLYALISPKIPYLLSILVVGIACFMISYIIGVIFLRIRGAYFTIASYALVLLFSSVLLYYEQAISYRTGRTVEIIPISNIYIVLVTIAVVSIIVAILIKKSKFGYGLSSIKGNEDLSTIIGINASLYKTLAFSICGFFIGVTAAAIIPRGGYIDTTVVFATVISFNVLVMGVLGGIGSIRGGIISALFLSVFFELFATRQNPFPFFIGLGVLLLLGIFFFPKGIEGSLLIIGKSYKSR